MNTSKYLCIVDDKADLRFILQKFLTLSFPNYPILQFEHGQALLNELAQADVLPVLNGRTYGATDYFAFAPINNT
jgi:DNA-binding NtrC family response regulator